MWALPAENSIHHLKPKIAALARPIRWVSFRIPYYAVFSAQIRPVVGCQATGSFPWADGRVCL